MMHLDLIAAAEKRGFEAGKRAAEIRLCAALSELGVEIHRLAHVAIAAIEDVRDWGFDLAMEHEGIGEQEGLSRSSTPEELAAALHIKP